MERKQYETKVKMMRKRFEDALLWQYAEPAHWPINLKKAREEKHEYEKGYYKGTCRGCKGNSRR